MPEINLGHCFVLSLTVIQLLAAICYYHQGDIPRFWLWLLYSSANVATVFIGSGQGVSQ